MTTNLKHIFILLILRFLTSAVCAQTNLFEDDDMLDAEIKINYSNTLYYPSKKEPNQIETHEVSIKSKLTCQIITFSLKRYEANSKTRNDCSPSMHCPILTGSSNYSEYDDKGEASNIIKFPLEVSVTKTSKKTKSNKLVTTYTYKASGTNEMESVGLEIKPYNAPFGQPQPLSPNYVIWLSGGKDWKYGGKTPYGSGSGQHWDDFEEQLVPSDGPFGIGIPYTFSDADHGVDGAEIYEQLLVSNYKELDNFLLNPIGSFTIKAAGKRYNYFEGNEEREGRVEVEIELTPHLGIVPLKIGK